MSLLVRLPLNGNLNNYGSADVTVTVTGATSYADGRAGKALSCNGSSYWTVTGVTLGSEASIACWSKTSTNGKMSWVLVATSSDKLNLYESSQYCLNTGDGNSNLFKDGSGNAINCLHDNQWHHFVVTFGNNIAKLYIDGAYRGTATTFKSPATTSANTIRLAGGYNNGHSYDWNGLISDFRVYNHCLSESEIKHLIRGKGLQLWLPLTKDLRQQGLSNVTVTNNGATFNSAGKLGGCYSFNGSSKYISITNPLKSASEVSCAVWVKPSTNTSTNEQIMNIGTSSGWNNIRFGILQRSINQFIFHVSNGTNNITYSCASGTIAVDQWIHISCIYKNRELKMYLNGELVKTYSISFDPSFTGITNIGIGAAPNGSEKFTGYISDVRIYDHALSQMEVKEIAKGLVLHYPLSDNSIQQMNNCYGYPRFETSSSNGGWNHWGRSGASGTSGQSTDSNYIFRSGQTYSHWVANAAGATGEYLLYQSPAFKGGSRSLQCICKETNGEVIDESVVFPAWNARSGGTVSDKWTSVSSLGDGFYLCKCEDIQQDGSNDLVGFYICPGKTVYFSEAYLENNKTCCSDMFYSTTTIYDCSGLCNNGSKWAYDTAGEIICANDTPKYQVSTYINSDNNTTNTASGTQYIYGNCELTTPQYLTVAFWCKPIAGYGNQTGQGQFSLTNNAIGASAGQDYDTCPMNHRDGYIDMCTSSGTHKTMGITFTANEWHHYAIIYDGRYGRIYKDGTATNSTLDMGSILPLKNMKGVVIGFSRAGGVWRSNKSYYSDFRIYATALSADDIAELYNGGVL